MKIRNPLKKVVNIVTSLPAPIQVALGGVALAPLPVLGTGAAVVAGGIVGATALGPSALAAGMIYLGTRIDKAIDLVAEIKTQYGPLVERAVPALEQLATGVNELAATAKEINGTLRILSGNVADLGKAVSSLARSIDEAIQENASAHAEILRELRDLRSYIATSNRELADRIDRELDDAFFRQAKANIRSSIAGLISVTAAPSVPSDELDRALAAAEEQLRDAIYQIFEFGPIGTRTLVEVGPAFALWSACYRTLESQGRRQPFSEHDLVAMVRTKCDELVSETVAAYVKLDVQSLPWARQCYADLGVPNNTIPYQESYPLDYRTPSVDAIYARLQAAEASRPIVVEFLRGSMLDWSSRQSALGFLEHSRRLGSERDVTARSNGPDVDDVQRWLKTDEGRDFLRSITMRDLAPLVSFDWKDFSILRYRLESDSTRFVWRQHSADSSGLYSAKKALSEATAKQALQLRPIVEQLQATWLLARAGL